MKAAQELKTILLVEDDPDDIYLISEAITECQLSVRLNVVENGEQLLDYLYQRENFSNPQEAPRPDLILLDLNMPRKDGREVLEDIKADPDLCTIPIVILTTSSAAEDLAHTYSHGASGFVTKPVSFEGLRETMCKLGAYWLNTVQLPNKRSEDEN
jgi:CheY-like chemotaxis protein